MEIDRYPGSYQTKSKKRPRSNINTCWNKLSCKRPKLFEECEKNCKIGQRDLQRH